MNASSVLRSALLCRIFFFTTKKKNPDITFLLFILKIVNLNLDSLIKIKLFL